MKRKMSTGWGLGCFTGWDHALLDCSEGCWADRGDGAASRAEEEVLNPEGGDGWGAGIFFALLRWELGDTKFRPINHIDKKIV